MIDAVLVAVLVALVAERFFAGRAKSDRAEELRSAMTEGIRKGFEAHKELTEQARSEVDTLYKRTYRDLITTVTTPIRPQAADQVFASFDEADGTDAND